MNCASARSSRASAPFSKTKRAPEIFAARGEIHLPVPRPAPRGPWARSRNCAGCRRGGSRRLPVSSVPRARRRTAGWAGRRAVRRSASRNSAAFGPRSPPRCPCSARSGEQLSPTRRASSLRRPRATAGCAPPAPPLLRFQRAPFPVERQPSAARAASRAARGRGRTPPDFPDPSQSCMNGRRFRLCVTRPGRGSRNDVGWVERSETHPRSARSA